MLQGGTSRYALLLGKPGQECLIIYMKYKLREVETGNQKVMRLSYNRNKTLIRHQLFFE
jgi:hypothetical protein